MPLDFDVSHFIPEKMKHYNRAIRDKDERILKLETENAMLHLKLAQVQAELERERKNASRMESSLITTRQRGSLQYDSLKALLLQIRGAKQELKTLRSAVVSMPTKTTQSLEMWAMAQAERLQHILDSGNEDYKVLQHKMSLLMNDLTFAQEKYMKEKERRRQLHNTLVELRGNIRVHCRVRPVLEYDVASGITTGLKNEESVVHVEDDENVSVSLTRPGHQQSTRTFEYERVYRQDDSQEDVFREVKPLLTSLLDGYNVCIMAYGQTGSGKTHTMLGGRYTQDISQTRTMLDENMQDGVVPRAARELFRLLREKPNTHHVEVSVVEVYNNEIRDLLTLNPALSRHDLFTGDDGSMEVTSLTQRPVTTAVEIVDLVRHGMTHRHEDATQVHAHSSRSHLVVTLTVTVVHSPTHKLTSRNRSPSPATSISSSFKDEQEIIRTKLQLVDLAGSECVGMSGVTGQALRETSHINRSLSALADVLAALAEGRAHVPYRNSRLTHLMKDSIGGDAKLLVVCCVSPTQRFVTETLQCLGFGSRARQVQRGPAKKRQGAAPSGTGDQSPIISGRGRQAQRHSIPALSESSIPVFKYKTSPMMQRRSSSFDNSSSHQRSGRGSPGTPRR